MSSQKIKRPEKVAESPQTPSRIDPPRDRLRDIIIVFVAYPITPTKEAERIGKKMPWLEVVSLVAKVVLAGLGVVKLVLES